MRCDVCGSVAVPVIGAHVCGFCGAADAPRAARLAGSPSPSPCRFSPRERSDFAAAYGCAALRELEAEGL